MKSYKDLEIYQLAKMNVGKMINRFIQYVENNWK
jgi:hypothetical protein